jgi:hypothetical protein
MRSSGTGGRYVPQGANHSREKRAVLHVALRQPSDASILVDGNNVVPQVHAVLEPVAHFLCIVSSKTISTLETVTGAHTAREWLLARVGSDARSRSTSSPSQRTQLRWPILGSILQHVRILGLGWRAVLDGPRRLIDHDYGRPQELPCHAEAAFIRWTSISARRASNTTCR